MKNDNIFCKKTNKKHRITIEFYKNDEFLFNCNVSKNIIINQNKVNSLFKSNIKKRKILNQNNHFEYLVNILKYDLKKCNFCNNYAMTNILTNIIDYKVHIIGIEHPQHYYCALRENNCPGKKLNPNSTEFVSKKWNISLDDALIFIKKRNKSPFYIENHKSDEDYRKSQSRDLNFFISKSKNKEEGKNKYEIFLKNMKYCHSEQYYIDKMGECEGKKHWLYLNSIKDSMSYSYFKKLYNNDEEKAKIEYDKRIESVKTTLNNMILRHGNINGHKKFNDYIQKCKDRNKNIILKQIKENGIENISGFKQYNVSKSSMVFFNKLVDKLKELNIIINDNEIFYGPGNEKALYNEITTTCYYYDFFFKKYRLLIEYNGIRYHPKSANDINFKHPFDKVNTTEWHYNKDQHKKYTAEKYNYNIIYVWEDDKQKLENCIKEIEKIIRKNEK